MFKTKTKLFGSSNCDPSASTSYEEAKFTPWPLGPCALWLPAATGSTWASRCGCVPANKKRRAGSGLQLRFTATWLAVQSWVCWDNPDLRGTCTHPTISMKQSQALAQWMEGTWGCPEAQQSSSLSLHVKRRQGCSSQGLEAWNWAHTCSP